MSKKTLSPNKVLLWGIRVRPARCKFRGKYKLTHNTLSSDSLNSLNSGMKNTFTPSQYPPNSRFIPRWTLCPESHLNQVWVRLWVGFILEQNSSPSMNLWNQIMSYFKLLKHRQCPGQGRVFSLEVGYPDICLYQSLLVSGFLGTTPSFGALSNTTLPGNSGL